MVFSKAGSKVEKACIFTHIAVTVESVREFRETFKRKSILKENEKGELRKHKGKSKKEPTPFFCPDAERDIPKTLQEYSEDIQAYFNE